MTIIATSSGSTNIEYRLFFDTSRTSSEIDDVVTALNNNADIQNIINASGTMNGVTATKTSGINPERAGEKLVRLAGITSVKYDGQNTKIVIQTVGSYKEIKYKATGEPTYLSTTSNIVDPPTGFTNEVDIKLINVGGNDITGVVTYTVDTEAPVITLIGDNDITLNVGETYTEQGVTVIDNSGESIAAVITGSVDVNTEDTYILTYTATDRSRNQSQITRTSNVMQVPIIGITFNVNNIKQTYGASGRFYTFVSTGMDDNLYGAWSLEPTVLTNISWDFQVLSHGLSGVPYQVNAARHFYLTIH